MATTRREPHHAGVAVAAAARSYIRNDCRRLSPELQRSRARCKCAPMAETRKCAPARHELASSPARASPARVFTPNDFQAFVFCARASTCGRSSSSCERADAHSLRFSSFCFRAAVARARSQRENSGDNMSRHFAARPRRILFFAVAVVRRHTPSRRRRAEAAPLLDGELAAATSLAGCAHAGGGCGKNGGERPNARECRSRRLTMMLRGVGDGDLRAFSSIIEISMIAASSLVGDVERCVCKLFTRFLALNIYDKSRRR